MDLEWFASGDRYLPLCLKDFHDQKDLFRSLHDWMTKGEVISCKMPGWVEGQIYVIDYFLKFMALHGLTLQKSRVKTEFCDLDETLKVLKDKELEVLKKLLNPEG